MKIIYLMSSLYNSAGTERVLSIKMNYLANLEGYEVVLITTDQKGRKPFFELNPKVKHVDLGLNYTDIPFIIYPIRRYDYYNTLHLNKKILSEIVRTEKPDIMVFVSGEWARFVGKLKFSFPVVLERHFSKNSIRNDILHKQKNWYRRMGAWWLTKCMVRNSQLYDKVVVLTREDKVLWSKTNDNVVQIYNPLPFEPQKTSELSSKKMITVGQLTSLKNYDSLVAAWTIVHSKHRDWTIDVWGNGELRAHLESLIRINGLQNVFFLRGVTKNIMDEYLNSSAYVMSSISEGFGMMLIEASACGLPLISYSCECGPRDIIEDGKNGILVPVNDANRLADAICTVIENEELRREMGKNSKIMSERFTAEKILPQWTAFFEGLVNKEM